MNTRLLFRLRCAPLACLSLLAACATPPGPPTVDESRRRPANDRMEVELQACKNDLHNTQLVHTQSHRRAQAAAAALANVTARQQLLAALQAPMSPPDLANRMFTLHFGFGETRVVVPVEIGAALVESARSAPLILLRGRTDGTTETPAESRIAGARAGAVRDYLVAAGVDPARIRTTYQPTGDHVADNASSAGQQLNRRVEIELYGVLPVSFDPSAVAQR